MIARGMIAAGTVLLTMAVFAVPPLAYVWLPGMGLVFAGWTRRARGRSARRWSRRRRGWLRG